MNTIYAWGYGDVLEKILQGIATLFSTNGGLMVMLGKIAILIAFMIVLLSYFSSAGLRDPLRVVRFYIVLLGVWTLFMQVKTTVQVDDVQANRTVVVDNVPWAIARPLAFLSQVQKTLAGYLDQAFGLPDACQYSKSGMFTCFGVLNSALNFRITDPYLYTSLNYFIQNCVYTNILDGTYDLDQLLTSDNIINMFGQNLHPSRFTKVFGPNDCPINQPCSGPCKQGCTLDCPTAWGVIQGQLNSYIAQAPSIIGGLNMMSATAVSDILGIAPSYLLQSSQTGASFLLQTVGINHFQDAYLRWAEANLAPGLGYGVGTAQRQVEQTGITSSFMAGKYLPVIKGIVAVLIAGLTPTLFILLLTPMAMRALQGTAILFVWLLTWTLGDALLNAIIQVKLSGMNFASLSGTAPITSLTLPVVSQTMMDYISMAGQFYWLIPTISLMASTGFGIYAMNSVVSAVSSSPQSASSQAGSQTATGNVQAGTVHYNEVGANNYRLGNVNAWNTSMLTSSFMTASALQRQIGQFMQAGSAQSIEKPMSINSALEIFSSNPFASNLLKLGDKVLGGNTTVNSLKTDKISGIVSQLEMVGSDGSKLIYSGNYLTYQGKQGTVMEWTVDAKNGRVITNLNDNALQFIKSYGEELQKIVSAQQEWAKVKKATLQASDTKQKAKILEEGIQNLAKTGVLDATTTENLLQQVRYMAQGIAEQSFGNEQVKQSSSGKRVEGYYGVHGEIGIGVGGVGMGVKTEGGGRVSRYSETSESSKSSEGEGGKGSLQVSWYDASMGPNFSVTSTNQRYSGREKSMFTKNTTSTSHVQAESIIQAVENAMAKKYSETLSELQKSALSSNIHLDATKIAQAIAMKGVFGNANEGDLGKLGAVIKQAEVLITPLKKQTLESVGEENLNKFVSEPALQKPPSTLKQEVEPALQNPVQEKPKPQRPKPKKPKLN